MKKIFSYPSNTRFYMTEYDFLLADRIAKIKSINEQFNLEDNAYISFSGGKDSTVLHHLVDLALPGNNIPRVFLNTGIEYKLILNFVRKMSVNDSRFVIQTVGKNIKATLEEIGYPFKSKLHSKKLMEYRKGYPCKSVQGYFGKTEEKYSMTCPKSLLYQTEKDFTLKISDKCCYEFKKYPAQKYEKESGRHICMTGMRKEEGGNRFGINCTVFSSNGGIKKFHPLAIVDEKFINEFVEKNNVQLCELYYPPYNFIRTGCKGSPYSLYLQEDLDILEKLLPSERKQCEIIWKPVYDEYRRIGYRLRKENIQPSLFDF